MGYTIDSKDKKTFLKNMLEYAPFKSRTVREVLIGLYESDEFDNIHFVNDESGLNNLWVIPLLGVDSTHKILMSGNEIGTKDLFYMITKEGISDTPIHIKFVMDTASSLYSEFLSVLDANYDVKNSVNDVFGSEVDKLIDKVSLGLRIDKLKLLIDEALDRGDYDECKSLTDELTRVVNLEKSLG